MATRIKKDNGMPPNRPTADQLAGQEGRAMLDGSRGSGADDASLYSTLGISGVTRWGGVSRVYEEFLRELQGPQGMKSLREMKDNCPISGAILYAAKHLARGVTFRIKAKDTSNEAEKIAEFVRGAIFQDMEHPWPDTLSESLSMLPFGWALQEMTFKKRQGMSAPILSPTSEPNTSGLGAPRAFATSRFNDGLIGFRGWSLRSQETLFMWEFDEDSRPIVMQQMAPPDYRVRRIPLSKSLLFRTEVEKNNPEGRSILRNAWTSYYFRKNIQIIEGVGIERDMAGYPVIKIEKPDPVNQISPPDIWNDKDANSIALLAQLQKIVRSVRRDEQEGMVIPWWCDFKLVSSGSGRRQFNTNDIITRYDERIAMSVLADFIMLGHNAVGSKALASTKTSLFSQALGSFLDIITGKVSMEAIPLLLELNGMNQDLAPTMEHEDVETINLADLGEYLSKLSGAGLALFPSPNGELETALLEHAKLPSTERPTNETVVAPLEPPDPNAVPRLPVKPSGFGAKAARLRKAAKTATAIDIGSRHEGQLRKEVLSALEGLTRHVSMSGVARGFADHDVNRILASIDWSGFAADLNPAVQTAMTAYREGAASALKALASVRKAGAALDTKFNLTNQQAIEYARTSSASLVRGITEDSRDALRDIIKRALSGQLTKDEAARLIRNVVGLTERQALAVENYRAVLLADGSASSASIETRTAKYADKLLKDRALVIARQEIMTAARTGQRDGWDSAAQHGLIEKQHTRRVWIVTDDDRLCPVCEAMDGQETSMDEPFHSENGPVDTEGAHVACRCDQGLVFDN